MTTLKFYQIEKPTTEQIINAIFNGEYVPIEKMESKAKQIKVLLLNRWNCNEIFVTFKNVTNSGGFPLFFSNLWDIYEIARIEDANFDFLSEEEQEYEIELLSSYTQTYDKIFDL